MVNSPETTPGAQYWYCQLLGVFHARVYRVLDGEATEPEEMSFLWVRWLGEEPGYRPSMKADRLPKVGFVPDYGYAFGFLDPAHVIRGGYLIPNFESGQTNDLLATREVTLARLPTDSSDWTNFFVNMYVEMNTFQFNHTHIIFRFVDRDKLMRYFGSAFGHKNNFVGDENLFPPPSSAAGPNTSTDSSNSEANHDALNGDLLGLHPRSMRAILFTGTGLLPIRYRRAILALHHAKYWARLPDGYYAKRLLRQSGVHVIATTVQLWQHLVGVRHTRGPQLFSHPGPLYGVFPGISVRHRRLDLGGNVVLQIFHAGGAQ
jgi:hypothetical protein